MTDPKQLLERYCRDADQQAFTRFYRQHADRLWRFLRAKGASEDTAYDLLAESFLRFIQVVCKDPRYPLALLYRIAINLQIDEHRRRQISPVSYDNTVDAAAFDGEAANSDLRAWVRLLIKNLPEREQNLLLLRYWIGLTHKEIAENLGIPEGTVRRECANAMNILKQRWHGDTE